VFVVIKTLNPDPQLPKCWILIHIRISIEISIDPKHCSQEQGSKNRFSHIFSALFFVFSRINRADVEVQTKVLEGGAKLTFMKFIFVSPSLEIKAPVLNDKAVGYQVGNIPAVKGTVSRDGFGIFYDTHS
jgi:hypothetical protein